MQVKLKVQVMVPFINIYLPKGTILDVADEKGKWYICQNKEVDGVFIQKDNCEVIPDEEN